MKLRYQNQNGHLKVTAETGARARGRVKVQVLDRDGRVIEDRPWQKNLILNQGLNNICSTYTWANAFLYCAAGSGTTATNTASGAGVTATGTAGTFTNDTPGTFDWTTNAAVGDMIKMTSGADSGDEVRITSITDANNVVYTPANALGSGEFTVYHTSQTGLTTELKRTNNYLLLAPNCQTTVTGSDVVHVRTFDFTAEVGSVTYNEVGFSNLAAVASNLFSRIKLASGVPLVAAQALRIIYELTVTLSPTTSQPATFPITGWPVLPSTSLDGDYQIIRPGLQGINPSTGISYVGSGFPLGWNGNDENNGGSAMEPSVAATSTNGCFTWISPSSAAIEGFASNSAPTSRATNATQILTTLASYTALNFYRDRTTVFAVGDANRTDFRSMGFGHRDQSGGSSAFNQGNCFVCLFDEAQTKDSLHTLTINWRFTVGRVLA